MLNIELSAILGVVTTLFAVYSVWVSVRRVKHISKAEKSMANLMRVEFHRQELENLRDELLDIKKEAITAGFDKMEQFYEIEHKLNLLTVKLDQIQRVIIEQGLQQPSEKGRAEYMLKLINLSIAYA